MRVTLVRRMRSECRGAAAGGGGPGLPLTLPTPTASLLCMLATLAGALYAGDTHTYAPTMEGAHTQSSEKIRKPCQCRKSSSGLPGSTQVPGHCRAAAWTPTYVASHNLPPTVLTVCSITSSQYNKNRLYACSCVMCITYNTNGAAPTPSSSHSPGLKRCECLVTRPFTSLPSIWLYKHPYFAFLC
ncbi:hypothetical protein E2C01_080324 [Portunus trituberculatus]|uniref:Uncharacterized protein n=1 Tax=Portunus trituberculatus TaxID=210409 RepID=A0A5B7IT53_PORTR|nr:hypothetical protein [Portunus trituberculatus]